ncbi:MAG: PQQ-binding-like beta-propeller repeat protein [Bacteroidetes bacterium]|nr:PQQ-binding-like beta-propeller repeat protein [Bacteroidota bacterium]MBL6943947.1 PQQ-binding-like beta-propeller repeat protein [Bacteroidales bacterium]
MKIYFRIIAVLFFVSCFSLSHAQLYDWRGPDRGGIYNETGLLKTWPESGPELLWELDSLGEGYSSVTISDDAIYVTGRKDSFDVITALTFDGEIIWETVYGKAWTRNFEGTRSTPTYYNGDIFLISGIGELVCLNSSGEIKWKRDHYQTYGGEPLRFGVSESPLVYDNKVIASPGGDKASLVAYNIENGDVIWEAAPLNEAPQYVNPKLVVHNGRSLIVTLTDTYIIGVDAVDGTILWKFNYNELNAVEGRARNNHTNTPLYNDGKVFIANGYKYVAVMLELSEDGSAAEVVWESRDIGPHHGGMLLLGDYIYATSYESNSMGNWVCVNWNTGETMWSERWINKGSIISADSMLYIFEEKTGNVGLVNPTPEKFDLVSSFQMTKGEGPFWAHPVIRDGRLYLRHGEVLMVHSIK